MLGDSGNGKMAKKDVKNDEIMYFKMNSIMKKTIARFFAIDTPCILYLNVVILKDRHGEVFFRTNAGTFFLRGRVDSRVDAFESPISQLSQQFLVVLIAPLEKILETFEKMFWLKT